MNNTNTTQRTPEAKMTCVSACAEAKRLAGQYGLPAFVYQTGAETFNYNFVQQNTACGTLIACYDKTGKSVSPKTI